MVLLKLELLSTVLASTTKGLLVRNEGAVVLVVAAAGFGAAARSLARGRGTPMRQFQRHLYSRAPRLDCACAVTNVRLLQFILHVLTIFILF